MSRHEKGIVMLTAEDRELLGIALEPPNVRRSSAVSQILREIHDDLLGGPAEWATANEDGQKSFHILVASDRKTRRRAYALAQRVYQGRGYVSGDEGVVVCPHDADPQTLTLLALDDSGIDAATITLVFDSLDGLPCDQIYGAELDLLRAKGRRLIEVTRLAIDENHQRSKELLVKLFNFIYIFARRVKGFDDFVIEVNPRHVNYYRRLLIFEQLGPERPCPRVQGAPAVLLRLDLSIPEREVRRTHGKGAAINDRTLYPYFYSWLEEGAVAEFLAHGHRPMSEDDARYFGLELDRSTVSEQGAEHDFKRIGRLGVSDPQSRGQV